VPRLLVINSCSECRHRRQIKSNSAWGSAIKNRCELMDKWIQSTGNIPRRCPLAAPSQQQLKEELNVCHR
jgi:hypothetical protein